MKQEEFIKLKIGDRICNTVTGMIVTIDCEKSDKTKIDENCVLNGRDIFQDYVNLPILECEKWETIHNLKGMFKNNTAYCNYLFMSLNKLIAELRNKTIL